MLQINLTDKKKKETESKSTSLDLDIDAYEEKHYGATIPQSDANWVKRHSQEHNLPSLAPDYRVQRAMTNRLMEKETDLPVVYLEPELDLAITPDPRELQFHIDEITGKSNVTNEVELIQAPKISPEISQLTNDLESILDEAKTNAGVEIDGGGVILSDLFAKSIDLQLTDLNATEEQKAMFKTALIFYLQARIDNHLQDVLPTEFFEGLDNLLETGEIEETDVIGAVMLAYEAAQGFPLTEYAANLIVSILPEFKKIFKQNEVSIEKILELSDTDQQQFISLMDKGDYSQAKLLLKN